MIDEKQFLNIMLRNLASNLAQYIRSDNKEAIVDNRSNTALIRTRIEELEAEERMLDATAFDEESLEEERLVGLDERGDV